MNTKTLPAKFFDDYEDRGLPTTRVFRRTARTVTVNANAPQIAELRADAAHYADKDGPDEAPRGLRASARATLRAFA